MYGDWEPARDRVAVKSIRAINSDWTYIDTIKKDMESYKIYKHNSEPTYIIGDFSEDKMSLLLY